MGGATRMVPVRVKAISACFSTPPGPLGLAPFHAAYVYYMLHLRGGGGVLALCIRGENSARADAACTRVQPFLLAFV